MSDIDILVFVFAVFTEDNAKKLNSLKRRQMKRWRVKSGRHLCTYIEKNDEITNPACIIDRKDV